MKFKLEKYNEGFVYRKKRFTLLILLQKTFLEKTKLAKMTKRITLKIATTLHCVFMYCATPALKADCKEVITCKSES